MFAATDANVSNEHVRALHAAYGALLGPPPVASSPACGYARDALGKILDDTTDPAADVETLDVIASRIVLISRYLYASSASSDGVFKTEMFDDALRALSEAYRRVHDEADQEEQKSWVPPDTFQRQTMKFWVQLEDVIALKVEILKRLPILLYRDSEKSSPLITSVYLENADFDVYRTRLLREEGATLVRLRWYGDFREDADVFVEKKTHYGPGRRSVKERRRVRRASLASLFDGEGKSDTCLGNFVTNVKTDEIERRGLKPALMTRYSRTAFQFASTNAVRISLDEDLRWSDVRAQGTRAIESPMSYTYTQPFQYAVLEVKLTSAADGTAAWIEDILATLKAVKVYKFSKYIHGCAKLMPHAVYKLPHWFDEGFEERRTKAVDEPTSRFASSGSFADLLRTTITNALGFRKHGVSKEERRSASDGEPDVEAPDSRRLQTRHVPVKVEPKTFFANERTLLQWLSMAILLLFLGLGLMTLETAGSSVSGGTPNVSAARFRWRTFACERRVRCDHRAHCGGFHDLRLVDLHRARETNRSSRAEHAVRRRFRSRRFSRHSLRRRHGEHRALRRERRLEPSRVRASDKILKNRKKSTVTVRHSHRPRRRIVESRTGRATYSENDARRRRVIFPDESSAP